MNVHFEFGGKMRKAIVGVLALGLGGLFAQTVYASGTLRFPETGTPAIEVVEPDGWVHSADQFGNLCLTGGLSTPVILIKIAESKGRSFDEFVAQATEGAQAAPPTPRGPIEISGYEGKSYDSHMLAAGQTDVNVHMSLVQPDAEHFLSVFVIVAEELEAEALPAGKVVVDSVRILTQ